VHGWPTAAVIVLLAIIVVPRLVSTPKPGVLVVSVMHATTAAKVITAQAPGNGAVQGKALLTGQSAA
jgi:hypothetical protein